MARSWTRTWALKRSTSPSTRGRSGVVSMMTTFSGAAVRSEISDAGKFSLDQYQRPSRPEHLAGFERKLEGGGSQVGQQDVQVVRVEAGLLGCSLEQELRVMDD